MSTIGASVGFTACHLLNTSHKYYRLSLFARLGESGHFCRPVSIVLNKKLIHRNYNALVYFKREQNTALFGRSAKQ
jgi:hypothetical protein